MDSGYFLVAFLNEVDFSTAQKILGSKVPSFGEKHWLPLTLLRINWAKQKQAFHSGVIARGLPPKNVFCDAFTLWKWTLGFKLTKNGFKGIFWNVSKFPIYAIKNT